MRRDDVIVLVKHRLEQADEVLEDARFLLEGNRSPRSIINRVYYAMFYAVLALLQTLGKVPSRHTGAISLFDREFVQKGVFEKELSTSLHRAFEMRQTSDYRVRETPTQADARELWNKADTFVLGVKEYLRQEEYGQEQEQ
jgi:hypothetical protein